MAENSPGQTQLFPLYCLSRLTSPRLPLSLYHWEHCHYSQQQSDVNSYLFYCLGTQQGIVQDQGIAGNARVCAQMRQVKVYLHWLLRLLQPYPTLFPIHSHKALYSYSQRINHLVTLRKVS